MEGGGEGGGGAGDGDSATRGAGGGASGAAENMAAWLTGPRDIRLAPYQLPDTLGPNEVRVRMRRVGICGSDVHYFSHMKIAHYVVHQPMVLGHESAGEVLEVGSDVSSCKVGDRVALEPGRGCGRCRMCKGGRYNLCPEMAFFATPPINGSLANQVVHPADLCFVLPEGVSLDEGALCEPLSVAIHACRRAGQLAGAHVAVMGAGPIGLLCMMVARASGAARLAIADICPARLALAGSCGADACVHIPAGVSPEKSEDATAGALRRQLGGLVDVVVDCVGREQSMRTALKAVCSGGVVLLVGMAEDTMALPLTTAAAREVDIRGVFRYCNTYEDAIELLRSKRVNALPLITHRYSFTQDDVVSAFKRSEQGGSAIKVMFSL